MAQTYKHSIWFFAGDETVTEFLSKFIIGGLLLCNNVLPEPEFRSQTHQMSWRKAHWGTTSDSIPVTLCSQGFEFESDAWDFHVLLSALAAADTTVDFQHKYASSDIGYSVGSFNYASGRLMLEKPVNNPERFACSVWGIDFGTYLEKRGTGEGIVSAKEVSKIVSSDEDYYDMMASILDSEDD